ncbi:MAG: energy transducer TonB [Bryobacteraceae bacterium]
MFEQSMVQSAGKKPWTMAASLTFQAATVGSLILLSVWHIERLPQVQLSPTLPFTPPRAVEIVSSVRTPAASSAAEAPRAFTAPVSIPTELPVIVDAGAAAPQIAAGPVIQGMEGLGVPGGGGAFLGRTKVEAAPPPSVPGSPAAEPEAAPKPVQVGGKVMEAMIVKRVLPVYPRLARDMRLSGTVKLVGVIAKDGTIQRLEVVQGHPLLTAAALDAVRQWVYRPTLLNGKPVEVIAPIEVHFRLGP